MHLMPSSICFCAATWKPRLLKAELCTQPLRTLIDGSRTASIVIGLQRSRHQVLSFICTLLDCLYTFVCNWDFLGGDITLSTAFHLHIMPKTFRQQSLWLCVILLSDRIKFAQGQVGDESHPMIVESSCLQEYFISFSPQHWQQQLL